MINVVAQPLTSNGYTLSSASHRLGRLTPSDPHASVADLREQYAAHGYLWLKGFLDRDRVLALRRRYFAVMAEVGLIAPDSDPTDGMFSGHAIDHARHDKVLMEFVRTAAYESFCLQPRVWEFYDRFLGGASYLHKRKILRSSLPGSSSSTPAHYDLIYLRGGTASVCTSWIPIGDVPVEMGGLVYLEGSDRIGREMEAEFARRNAELSPEERISAYNKNMAAGG
jgi:ectoine hydroxylase-related dioxygenase (phytanoyl-CoA dioxygenase family)